jgi:hypothetical protein
VKTRKLNAHRHLVYPLVRLRLSLRQLIVAVGVKVGDSCLRLSRGRGESRGFVEGGLAEAPFRLGPGALLKVYE